MPKTTRNRLVPLLITLALLLPTVVAGSVVGYFYAHQHKPAPVAPYTPQPVIGRR